VVVAGHELQRRIERRQGTSPAVYGSRLAAFADVDGVAVAELAKLVVAQQRTRPWPVSTQVWASPDTICLRPLTEA